MKKCTCGHVFKESEAFCPECGTHAADIPDIPDDVMPISAIHSDDNTDKKPSSHADVKTHDDIPEVAPISAIFEGKKEEDIPASKPSPKKPERPIPGPNVEVKPMMNSSRDAKFDPMKSQPPTASRFSVLTTFSTAARIFVLLIPAVGFIYAVVLTLGATKKENVKTLGTSFLIVFMAQIVLLAITMLVFMQFFDKQFGRFFDVIRYTIDTFFDALKTVK